MKEKAYLKSDLEFLGSRVPTIRSVAKGVRREHPDMGRSQLLVLTEKLWGRGIHECRVAAVELLDLYSSLLEPEDIEVLERMVRESRTWALVDGLAASLIGGLLQRHPDSSAILDRWAVDPDFWVRRAALLSFLEPLRRGEGDFARFAAYADAMLEETEFFIRKALGWVLREASKRRPDLVEAWLAPRTHRVSGVTIREAVKYLPESRRTSLLADYRSARPAT